MILSFILPAAYGLLFALSVSSYWSWFLLMVGLYLGYNFHLFDYILNPFYAETKSEFENSALFLFRQKKYFSYLKYVLVHRRDAQKLLTKSIFFIGASLPLTLFMITSGGSALGNGLTLGLCLANCKFLLSLSNKSSALANFFRHQSTVISDQQLKNVRIVYITSFWLLTAIAWWQKI